MVAPMLGQDSSPPDAVLSMLSSQVIRTCCTCVRVLVPMCASVRAHGGELPPPKSVTNFRVRTERNLLVPGEDHHAQ